MLIGSKVREGYSRNNDNNGSESTSTTVNVIINNHTFDHLAEKGSHIRNGGLVKESSKIPLIKSFLEGYEHNSSVSKGLTSTMNGNNSGGGVININTGDLNLSQIYENLKSETTQ